MGTGSVVVDEDDAEADVEVEVEVEAEADGGVWSTCEADVDIEGICTLPVDTRLLSSCCLLSTFMGIDA